MANEVAVKSDIQIEGGLLKLNSMAEAFRFAEAISKSELCPYAYRGKPHDTFLAMQRGAELRLQPLNALDALYVVQGRVSLSSKIAIAIVVNSPACETLDFWWEVDGKKIDEASVQEFPDNLAAVCMTKRKGIADVWVRKYTVGDAKRAKLWQKKTAKGEDTSWVTSPKDMLRYRVFGRVQPLYGDILAGLPLFEDIEHVEISNRPPLRPDAVPVDSSPDPLLVVATSEVVKEQLEFDASDRT